MSLLDLANESNLHPKRVASTKGGEYHSRCPFPSCGGKDRFILWPQTDQYWCRQCNKAGDSIQFCREVMSMSYREACSKVGVDPKSSSAYFSRVLGKPKFVPKPAGLPPAIWQSNATEFVLQCHKNLLNNPVAIRLLHERGFSLDSMKAFYLG